MKRAEAPTETAAELAGRIHTGADPEAETQLVARYARAVRLLLDRHSRTAAEAEDLFQETFCLAVAKLRAGELRDPSKLGAFLASLARHLATEHYRKAGRRRTVADTEAVESASVVAGGQLGELLRGEEADLVRHVLGELSTGRDREILFRFYIAEEDRDEIAADYGLTGLQFNRVLHRARQRYKALYAARIAALDPSVKGPAAARELLGLLLAVAASARLLGPLEG